MTMGHYATALVPYGRLKGAPLVLLLVCAQLVDLLWLALAFAGVEAPHPESALDVTMVGLRAPMTYSHSGAGVLGLAVIVGVIVQLVGRRASLSIACAGLVAGHWLCDLLSGWEHGLLFAGSPRVGLDLYAHSPNAAFAIEAMWAAAMVAFYAWSRARQQRPLTRRALLGLLAVFVGGSLVFVPSSYVSLRAWLTLAQAHS